MPFQPSPSYRSNQRVIILGLTQLVPGQRAHILSPRLISVLAFKWREYWVVPYPSSVVTDSITEIHDTEVNLQAAAALLNVNFNALRGLTLKPVQHVIRFSHVAVLVRLAYEQLRGVLLIQHEEVIDVADVAVLYEQCGSIIETHQVDVRPPLVAKLGIVWVLDAAHAIELNYLR